MENYTTKDIEQIIGMPARQVKFYCDSRVIVPVVEAGGRGRFRQFSHKNLLEFAVVRRLALFGLTVKTIYGVMMHLKMGYDLTNKKWLKTRPMFIIQLKDDGTVVSDMYKAINRKAIAELKSVIIIDLYEVLKNL